MAGQRTYKRSWKNLLINKSYQLRFTLFMVGLSGALVFALGFWVMDQAQSATQTGINNVPECQAPTDEPKPARVIIEETSLEEIKDQPAPDEKGEKPAPGDKGEAPAPSGEGKDDSAKSDPAPGTSATSNDEAAGSKEDGDRARPVVTLEATEMKLKEPGGDDVGAAAAAALNEADIEAQRSRFLKCETEKKMRIQELRDGYDNILRVLILVGVLLIIGLGIYGIKMTHKVAGPLFKVSLYLDKLRDGTYDTVYNLRKGDQLVDFYESFKAAHAGLRTLQEEDVAQLKELIAAAEAANIGEKSDELAAALEELKEILKAKEESLG
jgi:hypothetical protein